MTTPGLVEIVGGAPATVEVGSVAAGPGAAPVALVEVAGTGAVLDIVDTDGPGLLLVQVGGSRGPQGPAGNGAHTHTQAVAGTVWTITHALGFDPAGIVVTSDDGYTLDGFGVQILTPGSVLRLSFDIAVAGTAHLS